MEIEQYLQAGDIELRAKDIKKLLEEHNNMKQDIKRLKEEYIILQNASDEVEEEKDKEIERLNSIIKEVREYIEKSTQWYDKELGLVEMEGYNSNRIPVVYLYGLLGILDKENNNEDNNKSINP